MRIFHIVESLNFGGSETQAVEVAIRLAARGHEIWFGHLRGGPLLERLAASHIEAIEFPLTDLKSANAVRQLIRLYGFLRQKKFDVLQTHDLYSNLLAVPAAWWAGIPTILSCRRDLGHWSWYTSQNRRILRWIHQRSTWILANSNAVRKSLIEVDRIDASRIQVVHNAVDPERFSGINRHRKSAIPMAADNELLVVMVANMNIGIKGHDTLVESAKKVCSANPNVKFVLVGDGDFRSSIEKQVAAAGLTSRFYFLGRRTDIPQILSSCDIAVLSSNAEGLPNAVLEYLAAGLPTVATTVGGIPEIIENGISGMLVPPQRPDLLADALNSLIENPERCRKFAEAGRSRVATQFSYDRLISQLESLYGLTQ